MFERPPNGFFVRDLILFNHLRRGGYVSKGFVFEAPDLTNSPIADLNDFQEQLCLLLASLHENQRLQVQYFSDSDYKSELLRYQQETERFENLWTKRSRNERFARYWQAMTERKLRRQRVVIYVSRSLENVPKTLTSNSALREYYLTLLDQLEMEFTHVHHLLKEIFASAGTRVLPMTDLDHFKHYKTFLNPSLAERFDFNCAGDFQPELSIQENCWHSEGNGQSDFGFYLDGHYHSVIALTRWPRTTYPGIIQRLTNLRLLDYSITVNVDPLPVTQEISKEEKEHDRVAGDYASEKKISLLTVMEKKQKKIHALMQGQTIPFKALFVIRIWDKSKDGLNAKASAIKNAVNSMNSAQYFESNLPSTSKNLFFQTWPGWTWGRYEHRKLYSEHRYLADMLPVASTFTGNWDAVIVTHSGFERIPLSQENTGHRHAPAWHRHCPAGFRSGSVSGKRAGTASAILTGQNFPMNKDDKYAFLALPLLPVRLNALEAAWYLGFQPHEISILTGAGMLEPLGHPPANTPKFFSTESLAELRDNQKWLEKATDAISTYWRRKNAQKRAGRNGRTRPVPRASGV